MTETTNEQTDNEVIDIDISDESLEAAAFAGHLRGYTEFAYCTAFACPL